MKVGDVLRKKNTRIATIRMNETVAIAAQLMRASNISALAVRCRSGVYRIKDFLYLLGPGLLT